MKDIKKDLLNFKTKYNYELEKEIKTETKVSFDYIIKKLLNKNRNLTLVNIVTFKVYSRNSSWDSDEYQVYDIYYGLMDKEKASKYPDNIIDLSPENYEETEEMYEKLKTVFKECEFLIQTVKSIPTSSYHRKYYQTNFKVYPKEISLFCNRVLYFGYLDVNHSFLTGMHDKDYESIAFQLYNNLNKEFKDELNKKIEELKNIKLKLKEISSLTQKEISILRKLIVEKQNSLVSDSNLSTFTLNKKRK